MTCREKLAIEHPEMVSPWFGGGCCYCPSTYGYLDDPNGHCCGPINGTQCIECWDREIPENDEKENDIMTNKNKDQLLKTIEDKEEELKAAYAELEKFRKYQKYDDMADETFAIMSSLINSGFTREEAFTLLASIASNCNK